MTDFKLEVLTPENSQIIFIDHQPQMAFGVQSIDRRGIQGQIANSPFLLQQVPVPHYEQRQIVHAELQPDQYMRGPT
jgi:hypothetical protein